MTDLSISMETKPYIGDLETAILKCRTMTDFLTVQKTVRMIDQALGDRS